MHGLDVWFYGSGFAVIWSVSLMYNFEIVNHKYLPSRIQSIRDRPLGSATLFLPDPVAFPCLCGEFKAGKLGVLDEFILHKL